MMNFTVGFFGPSFKCTYTRAHTQCERKSKKKTVMGGGGGGGDGNGNDGAPSLPKYTCPAVLCGTPKGTKLSIFFLCVFSAFILADQIISQTHRKTHQPMAHSILAFHFCSVSFFFLSIQPCLLPYGRVTTTVAYKLYSQSFHDVIVFSFFL